MSPPARGRGLKQFHKYDLRPGEKSPPARGRGLKRQSLLKVKIYQWSPPARGRGLNLVSSDSGPAFPLVAPRTGDMVLELNELSVKIGNLQGPVSEHDCAPLPEFLIRLALWKDYLEFTGVIFYGNKDVVERYTPLNYKG